MDQIILPSTNNYTVYSKSGCINCTKVKKILKEQNIEPLIVDCDEYLIENKEDFLSQITELIGYEYKMFPIVFNNGKFIGGYFDVKQILDDKNITNNDSKIIITDDF